MDVSIKAKRELLELASEEGRKGWRRVVEEVIVGGNDEDGVEVSAGKRMDMRRRELKRYDPCSVVDGVQG